MSTEQAIRRCVFTILNLISPASSFELIKRQSDISLQMPSFPGLPHEASHLRAQGGRKSPVLSLSPNNTMVAFVVGSLVY